jgi:hypothetical protein
MLLLHLVELAFGQLFFNHTWLGVCVLAWASPCGLVLLLHLVDTWLGVCVLAWASPCGLVLLLHLVELAFSQLFCNHTSSGFL